MIVDKPLTHANDVAEFLLAMHREEPPPVRPPPMVLEEQAIPEAVSAADVDDMLLREFANARDSNRRADVQRWRLRALDKVVAEHQALGFAGFIVRLVDGELHIDGIDARDVYVPQHLRPKHTRNGDL